MHAGFFDVLHDAGDQDAAVHIGQRVDVDFGRVFQETVDQHGPVLRKADGFLHVAADGVFVVGDDHRAAAQHIAGAHQHRESDGPGDGARFLHAGRRAVCGRRNLQIVEQFAESFAILGQIDIFGIGADDRHAGGLQRQRQRQRRLPAELHDHAVGLFGVAQCSELLRASSGSKYRRSLVS